MKKLNNKGFSLVELIIVIAIMAILVGVVGTQVIPYLENSRKAKDQQVISGFNTAAVSAYSTEAGNLDSTKIYTIKIDDGSVTAGPSGADGLSNLERSFMSYAKITTSGYDYDGQMASKAGKAIDYVTVTIDGDTGDVLTETTITAAGIAKGYFFDDIENK